MHQRREGLLRNLINKSSPSYLNPKPYEVQHKEISFELGEICQEIMDANTSRGEDYAKKNGGKRRDADKHRIRTSGMCALDFFSHFRGCYEDDKLGELELAERVSYLMSLFCSARIVGNIPTVRDGEDPVTFLKKSLDMFSEVLRMCKKLLDDKGDGGTAFQTERRMAEEMVSLLPTKISRVHF